MYNIFVVRASDKEITTHRADISFYVRYIQYLQRCYSKQPSRYMHTALTQGETTLKYKKETHQCRRYTNIKDGLLQFKPLIQNLLKGTLYIHVFTSLSANYVNN